MAKRGWTDEETNYLIESYNNLDLTIEDIANTLGRKKDTIVKKARALGIKKLRFKDVPVPQGHRLCRACREIKPYSEFHKNISKKNDPYASSCKDCCSMRAKELRHKKILDKIQKQVQLQDDTERKEKEAFLLEIKGKLFKCSCCKLELPSDKYTLVRKNGKLKVKVWCKKCSVKKAEENKLKNLRIKGYE